MSSTRNVCLPLTYAQLSEDNGTQKTGQAYISGISPVYPFPRLRENAARCGFSNLGREAVLHEIPIVVREADSLRLSFGAALAAIYLNLNNPPRLEKGNLVLSGDRQRLTIPLESRGKYLPDYCGDLESIKKIGLIDLLQVYENYPDSLNLQDRLVIVGVTLPGVSSTAATPLTDLLPASLVHATVAENIITGRFLLQTSRLTDVAILVIFMILVFVLWRFFPVKWLALLLPGTIVLYWLISLVLFTGPGIMLPLLYPTAIFMIANGWMLGDHIRAQRREMLSRRELLEQNISDKELELKTARENLSEIQEELISTGQESEQLKKLVEERQQYILRLENELRDLRSYSEPARIAPPQEFPEIIRSGESGMNQVLDVINRIRDDDIPVLIMGETGTGKELIARTIHNTSRRRDKAFVAVNCGALPENLLESELFGHEKGSFTGAFARRRGRFELADGGTFFLDEVSETTPAFQARLLRVLQEGRFERLGGEVTLQVDVRIIAASNRNLQQQLDSGRFRSDLYFRLNGIQISLPPLRERNDDIPFLAQHFLQKYDYHPVDQLSSQVVDALKKYSWPGNVRELENSIRRAAIMAQGEQRKMIRLDDLPAEVVREQKPQPTGSAYLPLEKQILDMMQSLQFSHSSISATARALGNRDRGTITEYLRGICFETLSDNDFDPEQSARIMAASDDPQVIERVSKKINSYLDNLHPLPPDKDIEDFLSGKNVALPQIKNLPGKYHIALIKVIRHLKK
jgi:transcriptional regulator with GAF, ATPase, and Fis domain